MKSTPEISLRFGPAHICKGDRETGGTTQETMGLGWDYQVIPVGPVKGSSHVHATRGPPGPTDWSPFDTPITPNIA
jgi:hypothetical protein